MVEEEEGEGKAREGKARKGKAREGKARKGDGGGTRRWWWTWGGGHGTLSEALSSAFPSLLVYNLDLPEVIDSVPPPTHRQRPTGAQFISGDMFDPSTIPSPCDVVLMKHVLADWNDTDAIAILRSCRQALREGTEETRGGRVVIAEAALLDGEEGNGTRDLQTYADVLLMIAGNIRGERTVSRWGRVARQAGFVIDEVASTTSPIK